MSIKNGRAFLAYFATAAPTLGHSTADAAYTVAAYLVSLSISSSVNAIDISNKDSGENSEYLGGRRSTSFTATMRFKTAEDGGQGKFVAAFESATKELWFLFSSDVAGDEEYYGKAILTSYDVNLDDESAIEVSISANVTGALTQGTIT